MNNGKICVSVSAKTIDELLQLIRRAEPLADVVEVRFDCLSDEALDSAVVRLGSESFSQPLLATFRPKENADLTPAKRVYTSKEEEESHKRESGKRFQKWLDILDIPAICLVDFEYDIYSNLSWCMLFVDFWDSGYQAERQRQLAAKLNGRELILSEHYFLREKIDLFETYQRLAPKTATDVNVEGNEVPEMRFLNSPILKVATRADEITEAIPVWQLLEKGKSDNNQVIPIAMGEAGKWTRILGPAHGAFMTYAALDASSETAPGQISAADMIDVFRVKELDESTNVYGIIAGNTSYSVSPWMHNSAFKASELNSVFVPLQVADLDAFFTRMVSQDTREIELNFKGFSVTNPHKQTIMRYLDEIDESAKRIGAVNTVKIEDGRFYGYNTDAQGFIPPLEKRNIALTGSRIAVFGAGGAARACIYMLQQAGANVTVVARNEEKGPSLAREFGIGYGSPPTDARSLSVDFDIIVNTTPVGTAGLAEESTILKAAQLDGLKLVYDLVYNPSETTLLKEAKIAEVPTIGGLEMLLAQGARQFEIWTGRAAPLKQMEAAVRKRLNI